MYIGSFVSNETLAATYRIFLGERTFLQGAAAFCVWHCRL